MGLLGLVLPWWAKWAALAILAAAIAGVSAVKMHQHDQLVFNDYKAKQALAAVKIFKQQVQVLHEIEVKYVDRVRIIQGKTETLIKEVPVYVSKADDDRCTVNAGFVRVHDAAWAGVDPPTPSESDHGPSGVPLSGVEEAVAANAGACLQWKEQALGLRKAYELVRQAQDQK